jgi:dTDP-4-amino-4,6-dideoxygalactose transaminase
VHPGVHDQVREQRRDLGGAALNGDIREVGGDHQPLLSLGQHHGHHDGFEVKLNTDLRYAQVNQVVEPPEPAPTARFEPPPHFGVDSVLIRAQTARRCVHASQYGAHSMQSFAVLGATSVVLVLHRAQVLQQARHPALAPGPLRSAGRTKSRGQGQVRTTGWRCGKIGEQGLLKVSVEPARGQGEIHPHSQKDWNKRAMTSKHDNPADDPVALDGPPSFKDPLHVGRPNIGDKETFLRFVDEIFDRKWLTNDGPLMEQFEQRIAEYLGVKNCVAMSNGTIALEIAIRALGLSGEVIVPAYTFIATAHALHWQGITPVFADVDPKTQMLDPAAVRRMITSRTTGIIGVHLWGRGAPVDELQAVADEYGLALMFDAAHALGCSLYGKMIGGFGRAEVLSFHATKFFNTFEGGALLTNDDVLADKARLMRNFGFQGDDVIYPGTNGKMSEICAAMGLTNLDSIDLVIETNRRNYYAYRDMLADLQGISLIEYNEAERNNFQYIVAAVRKECPASRDDIVDGLRAKNVLARKYFWPGCHRMEPYRSLFPNAGLMLPHTEELADQVVVLPNGMDITSHEIGIIAEMIRCIVRANHGQGPAKS